MTAQAVAQAAVALRATALPGPVLEAAKLHVLDAIGVGLAALRGPENTRWADALAQVGGAGQATVLMEFLSEGANVKALLPGWAAHTGLIGAALAQGGMTGPGTILEGRFGVLAGFAGLAEGGRLARRWPTLAPAGTCPTRHSRPTRHATTSTRSLRRWRR